MKSSVDLYKNNDVILNDAFDRFVVDIHLLKRNEGYKTFALCGSESRVGTTTIAINFAMSTAASGWKTVLIDADISKGIKKKRLNDQVNYGVVEYLMEECPVEDIIYSTNNVLLDYIPCGAKEDDMVRILCSSKMDELFEELKTRYDFIIFDLPAMDASIDTTIFCAKSDCAILVTSLDSSRRELEEAKKKMQRIGTKVLGVIVNQVDEKEYQHYLNNNKLFRKDSYKVTKKLPKLENSDVELAMTLEKKEKKKKRKNVSLKMFLFSSLLVLSMVMNSGIVFAAKSAESTQVGNQGTDYSKSRILLSSYEIVKGQAKPGEEITLKVVLKNTSATKNVNKVLVTFTSEGGSVYPVLGESGQIYLDTINANGDKEALINMKISDKVDVDHVLISFAIEFYDKEFGYTTNTTYIALPIQEENLLSIDNLNVSNQAQKNAKTLVSIKYSNNSETEDITDLIMHIEGNIPSEQKEVSLGDIAPGKQLYTDYYVSFGDIVEEKLTIYFTYSDMNDNTYTTESTEHVVEVVQEDVETTSNNKETKADNSIGDYIRIGAFVLLIVAVGILYMKRKK